MPKIISDKEISGYLSERKPFDPSILRNFNPSIIKGHKKKSIEFNGEEGTQFRLYYRESMKNPLDFSVGLYIIREDTGEDFCLVRYNGKSHRHQNKCPKGPKFFDFHIHQATKECQEKGIKEEDFAVITKKYSTAKQALDCILHECGFRSEQQILFVGEEN
jgi:hypothetical protein